VPRLRALVAARYTRGRAGGRFLMIGQLDVLMR
jgi:hypothetical protein